jgi:hypothetical protein
MITISAHHHHSPVFGSHPGSLATPDGGEGLPVLELGLEEVLVGARQDNYSEWLGINRTQGGAVD